MNSPLRNQGTIFLNSIVIERKIRYNLTDLQVYIQQWQFDLYYQ